MRSAYFKAYSADVFYARACYLKKSNPMDPTCEPLLNRRGAEVVSPQSFERVDSSDQATNAVPSNASNLHC
jgi:hypothetical protein